MFVFLQVSDKHHLKADFRMTSTSTLQQDKTFV